MYICLGPDIYDVTLIFMTFSRWQFGCPLKWSPPDSDSDSHYVSFMNGICISKGHRSTG